MRIKPIRTTRDYEAALRAIESLMPESQQDLAHDTGTVIESVPESLMPLSFNRSFFFYFPYPLAEGNV